MRHLGGFSLQPTNKDKKEEKEKEKEDKSMMIIIWREGRKCSQAFSIRNYLNLKNKDMNDRKRCHLTIIKKSKLFTKN